MQTEKKSIIKIESARPSLSREERLSIWLAVEKTIVAQKSVPSPYVFNFIHVRTKTITTFFLVVLLIVVGGGTAFASNAAKPGDLLFPLDRTLETIQLQLVTSDLGKQELKKHLTEERLKELRDIIDEELVISATNFDQSNGSIDASSATSTSLTIEVDVFTDMTIVKIELNGKKLYFQAQGTTRTDVIAEIANRFPALTQTEIESQLEYGVEDRSSRPQDRGVATFSSAGESRINGAVEEILGFLDKTTLNEDHRQNILSLLSSEVSSITEVRRHKDGVKIGSDDSRVKIRIDDNGDSRVEFKNGQSRVEVEEKKGEVRIDTKKSTLYTPQHARTVIPSSSSSALQFTVEATAFTDVTVVKLELDDTDVVFETKERTRVGVVSAIHDAFTALSLAEIDQKLDFEVKQRASVQEDGGASAAVTDDVLPVEMRIDDEDEHGDRKSSEKENRGRGSDDHNEDEDD